MQKKKKLLKPEKRETRQAKYTRGKSTNETQVRKETGGKKTKAGSRMRHFTLVVTLVMTHETDYQSKTGNKQQTTNNQ